MASWTSGFGCRRSEQTAPILSLSASRAASLHAKRAMVWWRTAEPTCSSAHCGSFPSVRPPSSVLMASRMLCAKPGLREAGRRARTCRKAARTSGQRWVGVNSQPRASSCRATGRSASAGSPSDPGAGASSACICSRCPCRALCERTPPGAGKEQQCAELQVGSAVLHQTMARFACSEAARLANSERIGAVCSLLRQPNPDVQLAILSWVIEGEGEECKELEKALQLTLLENLQSVLRDRRNKEFLKLYLEALMHLCRNLSSWSPEASPKLQGSSSACVEMLLLMMETEHPGPDLLFQALCVASLLLTLGFGDEDSPLVWRWCAALEVCSRSVSAEVLRLAAARSLQTAGMEVLRRSLGAAHPWLVPVALRVINVAIHLLQDEEQEVRHEASAFASLVQHGAGEPGGDGCVFVQGNVGLLGLLQLLPREFGHHPETFSSLLQHLPVLDLRGIVEELEANKAPSLYKEDEPNVFAEPAVLAQQLLPFLLQLLEKVPDASLLRASTLRWLEAAGPGVLQDLQYCKHLWSQEAVARWWMKALGCAKLRAALVTLLVRARLVAHALRVLGESHGAVLGLGCGAQELEQELALVQGLLAQHGLAPAPSQGDVPRELGSPPGND